MNDTPKDPSKTDLKRRPDNGRRKRLYVRLDDKELHTIRTSARKAGVSMSSYARRRLLGNGEARPTIDLDVVELRKAFADLKHAGSNLNQCARVLNTFGADEGSAASTKRAMHSVSAAADSICTLLASVRG